MIDIIDEALIHSNIIARELEIRYTLIMKNILFLFILINIGHFSFAQENVEFFHKALGIEISYPNDWKVYSFPNKYKELDFSFLSKDEIREMLMVAAYSPILFIKKHHEVYFGINPSIRITARRILNYPDYYNENFDYFDAVLNAYLSLFGGDIIGNKIFVNDVELIHKKIFNNHIANDPIYDERFEGYTEYLIKIRYGYIIIFEIQYGKNNIDDSNKNYPKINKKGLTKR